MIREGNAALLLLVVVGALHLLITIIEIIRGIIGK